MNGNWRQGKGRFYKSGAYTTWYEETKVDLVTQAMKRGLKLPLEPSYYIEVRLPRLDNRKRDADNFIKPLFDVLSEHRGRGAGVIVDDHLIERHHVSWNQIPYVEVTIMSGVSRTPALKKVVKERLPDAPIELPVGIGNGTSS